MIFISECLEGVPTELLYKLSRMRIPLSQVSGTITHSFEFCVLRFGAKPGAGRAGVC